MPFKRKEFLSYLIRKRKRNVHIYPAYLQHIEQKFKVDLDKEYYCDSFTSLNDAIKTRLKENRYADRRSTNDLRKMLRTLRKYYRFLKTSELFENIKNSQTTDWSVKDTMVGTVRDSIQLKFILKSKSYYVPASYMTEDALSVKYIALHEQGIGSEPGIHRFGEVIGVETVKRKSIPVPITRDNDNEAYCYFKVHRWENLPRSINIRDTHRGKPLFTVKHLLDSCVQSYQLFSVSSDDDYGLMTALNTALDDIKYSDYENFSSVYPINKRFSLKVSDGHLTLMDDNENILERVSVGSYLYRPKDYFEKMKNAITLK